MRDGQIGRVIRMLRHRRGWRQTDLCARARRPRSALVDLEAGRIGRLSVDLIRDFVEALGGRLMLDVSSGASDPRLLIDAGHARIGEHWKRRLERWGWLVRAEVSFNRYGDRGRIDLLAFHPRTAVLPVIEIKTVLWDIQALLGSMDVKRRVAPFVAMPIGWESRRVVPLLLIAASTTVRRRLTEHASLFASYELRGRSAISWLRHPAEPMPQGAIILTDLPDVPWTDRRRAGRRRIRRQESQSSMSTVPP
jgi:transcriptional regulator with XRE-family HTH domain